MFPKKTDEYLITNWEITFYKYSRNSTWIADLFEESVEAIQPDTPRDEIAAWDSLGSLSLIAGLDETFEIDLEDEELHAMKTVDDILEILRKNGKIT